MYARKRFAGLATQNLRMHRLNRVCIPIITAKRQTVLALAPQAQPHIAQQQPADVCQQETHEPIDDSLQGQLLSRSNGLTLRPDNELARMILSARAK